MKITYIRFRILGWLLCLCMVVSLLPGVSLRARGAETIKDAAGFDENGLSSDGSSFQPAPEVEGVYRISNAGQLLWFAQLVNGGNTAANAQLTADITMDGISTWSIMQTYGGIFDGNGKTISGLNCNAGLADGQKAGFVRLLTGTVKNTTFRNCSVFQQDGTGCAVIAYNNSGTIGSCMVVDCEVQLGNYSGLALIAGKNLSGAVIENCGIVGGNVTRRFSGINNQAMASITQQNSGTVKNTFAYGFHLNNNSSNLGALVYSGNAPLNSYYYYSGENVFDSSIENIPMTAEQFACGEVGYLLGDAWGQDLASHTYPVLNSKEVYKYLSCDGTTSLYTNDAAMDGTTSIHDFSHNGFCTLCDGFAPAEGSGTEADPYKISTPGQLYWFSAVVNAGYGSTPRYRAAYGVLTNSITVNENVLTADGKLNSSASFRSWTPIGNSNSGFTGTLDGKGFTVSGLYYNDSTSCVGLVGCLSGGTVKNVGVTASYIDGGGRTGAVVGSNENGGTVDGCYNTGIVYSLGEKTGGVVGSNYNGTVTRCYNTGTVNSISSATGGVVGHNYGTSVISNCYNTAPLDGYMVGGIAGRNNQDATVTNCYNIGTVTGSGYAGSVVGTTQQNATVLNCYYLDTSAHAGESGGDVPGATEAVTQDRFASGEIAYVLGEAWGQKIGTDSYPVLGGEKIYLGYTTCDEAQTAPVYSNDANASQTKPAHSGGVANCQRGKICTVCGAEYGEPDLDNHADLRYQDKYYYIHIATCSGCGVTYEEDHTMDQSAGKCQHCDRLAAASTTIGSTTQYYFYLGYAVEALKNATAEDKALITLVRDSTTSYYYQLVESGVFTIDLNGLGFTSGGNSSATLILRGGDVTIIDSKGTGRLYGSLCGAQVHGGASLTLTGGDMKSLNFLRVFDGGRVVISGGTFSRTYEDGWNITDEAGTGDITLTVGENGMGPTFVNGIKVKGTTLEKILGEGMAYRQNGKQVTLTPGQTEITGGDVTVEKACSHGDGTGFDENGICRFCGASIPFAEISSHTLSLTGNIAINYYMRLSPAVLADPTAYMHFTMANGQTHKIPVTEGMETVQNGTTYYVFTCEVGAKEMTDNVLAQFFYAGGATEIDTYSVKAYANRLLSISRDEKLLGLITAMLRYGATSQLQFGYHTDALADSGLAPVDYSKIPVDVPATTRPVGTESVKYAGATLILNSETTLRFYFETSLPADTFTVTYEGQPLAVQTLDQRFYVDIKDIAAPYLDEDFTVTLNDGVETVDITYSPLSYCASVKKNPQGLHSETLVNVVTALYLYNQASDAYFGSQA